MEPLLQDYERAAAEARAQGKRRRESNDDDADSDTELANVLAQQPSALRMASLVDGTMSAKEYNAPSEIESIKARCASTVQPSEQARQTIGHRGA